MPGRESDERPVVPGYVVGEPLGRGASGCVWQARSATDGAPVAVKVVGVADEDRFAREVAVLRSVEHAHLLPVLDAVALGPHGWALVVPHIDGGSLADLLAARHHLLPGEVVTLVCAVAGALAALHERGVHHGDIAPTNVLLDRQGRPVLADLGASGVVGLAEGEVRGTLGYVDPEVLAGSAPDRRSDVYALAAVAWTALVGAPPAPGPLRPALSGLVPDCPVDLVAVVEDALCSDPARRPDARTMARAAYDAAPAEPLVLADEVDRVPSVDELTARIRQAARVVDPPPPAPARHRLLARGRGIARHLPRHLPRDLPRHLPRQGRGVGRLMAVAAALCLVALAATGVRAATAELRAGPAATDHRPAVVTGGSAVGAEETPEATVTRVAAARASAFAAADYARLAAADVPGSPALAADRRVVAGLLAERVRYRGLTFTVTRVRLESATPERRTVVAQVAASAYDVVGPGERVVRRVPATPPRGVRLALVLTDGRWLVHQVTAVDTASR